MKKTVLSVITVVALLVSILISVMIYFNISNVDELKNSINQQFTGITNTSDVTETLTYAPASSEFAGKWYNSSLGASPHWATLTSGLYTLTGKTLVLHTTSATGTPKGDACNMTEVNVTYNSSAGVGARGVNSAASGVFSLAPLIAYMVIAGIILAVIMRFGKNEI